MTKKNKTSRERQIEFLEDSFVFEIMRQDIRIKKIIIKGGFGDWLMVITARREGQEIVCFIGGLTLQGLAAKLHQKFLAGELDWKDDRYAG